MLNLFRLLKKLFNGKQVQVSLITINNCKEIAINIFSKEQYILRLTINHPMELICMEIINNKDSEVILANYEKFFKKHICLYSFYLKAKQVFDRNNKGEILGFLQDFGVSLSYTHFVSLLA